MQKKILSEKVLSKKGLSQRELPSGWPTMPPIYDIHRSYMENAEEGPFYRGPFIERILPPKEQWTSFLGVPVASMIGVPAGPLLNSRWVSFAAKMGFDIVTYKTIRSKVHPAHPVPNMIYVDTKGPLNEARKQELLYPAQKAPADMDSLALTNSFGIPSKDPDFLIKDIENAQKSLHEGQAMIVSIVGTPRPNEDFVEDFALAAALAKEAGSRLIEADFSCPNVVSCEGSIHTNPETIYTLCKRMKEVIGNLPLIIKVGVISQEKTMKEVMQAAVRSGVEAICGINTVSMKVVNPDGSPALGPNRIQSGVCGGPIRGAALDFIKMASKVNREEQFGLTIMGTGGVTLPEHFDLFFEAGADVAMSAVGMMWDPFLALRYSRLSLH